MPQGLKKAVRPGATKRQTREGGVRKASGGNKSKKHPSAKDGLQKKATRAINASIEAQMIAKSERDKRGALRLLEPTDAPQQRKNKSKGARQRSERKVLLAKAKAAGQ